MKSFGFGEMSPKMPKAKPKESISVPSQEAMPPHPLTPDAAEKPVQLSEDQAESYIAELVQKHTFLEQIHLKTIEAFDSPFDALSYIHTKIEERERRTFRFAMTEIPGVTMENVTYEGLRAKLEKIVSNSQEIGRGGDGYVVVDTSEIPGLPPEICYKFNFDKPTFERGRNMLEVEISLQEKFYTVANAHAECPIGVPAPFYTLEIGGKNLGAMEKLPAKSIDDILRSKGTLPPWFEVDIFCNELRHMLDTFHASGLYHRDMHLGNIMISQAKELAEGEKMGFIIDFGLSTEKQHGTEPYKDEAAGKTFTYSDDYSIIPEVRRILLENQKRSKL